MRSISVFIRLLLVTAAAAAMLPATRAAPVEFNLPAQRADSALLLFSQQAKVELVFSSDTLRQANCPAVTGTLEPEAALALLLRDTGFVARRNFRGKFVIATAPPAPGAIRGRLVAPDGRPVGAARVNLREAKQTVIANAQGDFEFSTVPPGVYHLVALGVGYQTLLFAMEARVESGRTLMLEPQVMRAGGEPTRLDPMVVEGRTEGSRYPGDETSSALAQTAVSNLDLRRTQDDALPYTIFNREQIARSGVVNLNEFLQRNLLDSDASTRPPEQSPKQESLENFSAGSANLKLRGYTAEETIVLVNGRRLPETQVSAQANTNPQTPDVNFIPLSLVDRVEVLPVSASAVYSGNAVGGVINIVLRPAFKGTVVTSTYTNAMDGFDAPQASVSLQHGETLLGGKMHARFGATFTRTVPVTESELGYIRSKNAHIPYTGQAFHRATPNVSSADDSPLSGPGSASFTSVAPGANGSGGIAAFAGRNGVRSTELFDSPGGMGNSPDSSDFPYGRKQEGYSYFGSVTYDVLPWLQVGLDGITTRTVLTRGYTIFPADLKLSADSPFNPFKKDLNVSLNETAPALGQNYSEARLEFSSAVLGLLVRLPQEWRVLADAQYGHSLTRYRGLSNVDTTRWQGLVDQGIYNPLRDTQVFGPPQEFYDRVLIYSGARGQFVTLGNYDTLDTSIRLSNQSISWPTGSGALNIGGDYRRNHLQAFSNERRYGDGTLVDTPARWSGRRLERLSAFAEIQAPLLPSRWLPRPLRSVDLDLAVRYVAAASKQETNIAPTGGIKIDFDGGFSFRATVATSNRLPPPVLSRQIAAPVNKGTGGGELNIEHVNDPRRGGVDTPVIATEEVNPDLRPESAVSRTVGLIYQRGKIHRLRVAVDYIDTRKSGELFGLTAQDAVTLENVFPGRVQRGAPAPDDPNGPGVITSVLTGGVNLAWRESQNWNTSVDYAWTGIAGGKFEAYAKWIYFPSFKVQLLPGSTAVDEIAHPDTASFGLMRHRVNFGAGWIGPRFGFGADGYYFHSRILPEQDWASQGSDRIKPLWQFDVFVQSDLTSWLPGKDHRRFGLRTQVRISNVLDTAPPRYADDPSQTGVQAYGDWRGRVYSVSVTATF